MFKKSFSLFLITFICFLLIACNTNQRDNSPETNPSENRNTDSTNSSEKTNSSAEIQPEESTYTVNNFEYASITNISTNGDVITLEFTYTGENELDLGEWFVLETYENGTWYTLPYDIENCWQLLAYPVAPNQSKSLDYNLKYVYEPLSTGKYRIVTSVLDFIETGNYTKYYLAAEFEIE